MKRIKNSKEKQFNVRVTQEQWEQIRRHAWDNNMAVSTIVRRTLETAGVIKIARGQIA